MARTLLLGILAVLLTRPAAAQGALTGVWQVQYPAGVRVDNGVQTTIMGTGTLRIETRGDSLLGEFRPDPAPDLPEPAPVRLGGVPGPGPVALVAHQVTVVEVNGAPRPIRYSSTWTLEVRGDSLVGTLAHRVEDATVSAQDPGPVRGVRRRP